jgi:cell division protein FtsZ
MLFEVEQAANRIRAEVDPDANIIFGNTILDEMEGRIRVSVVATGIDAELSRMPVPEKVVTHNRFKAGAVKEVSKPFTLAHQQQPAAPAPAAAAANPVAEQIDQLAREMGVGGGATSASEAYILGTEEAPEVAAQVETPMTAARYPATESYRPLDQQPLSPARQAAQPKKRGWGFFGRSKPQDDMRSEPMAEHPAPIPQPRATAQTMSRPAPVEQPVPAQQQAGQQQGGQQQGPADDLFPDHRRDEQFEIPAFLRRQAN